MIPTWNVVLPNSKPDSTLQTQRSRHTGLSSTTLAEKSKWENTQQIFYPAGKYPNKIFQSLKSWNVLCWKSCRGKTTCTPSTGTFHYNTSPMTNTSSPMIKNQDKLNNHDVYHTNMSQQNIKSDHNQMRTLFSHTPVTLCASQIHSNWHTFTEFSSGAIKSNLCSSVLYTASTQMACVQSSCSSFFVDTITAFAVL